MKFLIILLCIAAASYGIDTVSSSISTQPVGEEKETPANANIEIETDYSTKSGLGFCGGATSGIGFAYRKHFQNRFGIHAGAFFLAGSEEDDEYYDQDYPDRESWLWTNLGLQGMYTIHRHTQKFFRFYALAGGEVLVRGEGYEEKKYNASSGKYEDTGKKKWKYENLYIAGAGLGFEFLILDHVGFSIEIPLSVQIDDNGFTMWPIGNGTLLYFF